MRGWRICGNLRGEAALSSRAAGARSRRCSRPRRPGRTFPSRPKRCCRTASKNSPASVCVAPSMPRARPRAVEGDPPSWHPPMYRRVPCLASLSGSLRCREGGHRHDDGETRAGAGTATASGPRASCPVRSARPMPYGARRARPSRSHRRSLCPRGRDGEMGDIVNAAVCRAPTRAAGVTGCWMAADGGSNPIGSVPFAEAVPKA